MTTPFHSMQPGLIYYQGEWVFVECAMWNDEIDGLVPCNDSRHASPKRIIIVNGQPIEVRHVVS